MVDIYRAAKLTDQNITFGTRYIVINNIVRLENLTQFAPAKTESDVVFLRLTAVKGETGSGN